MEKKVRLNVNVPASLLRRLDDFSSCLGITRTDVVCILLSYSLDNYDSTLYERRKLCQLLKLYSM